MKAPPGKTAYCLGVLAVLLFCGTSFTQQPVGPGSLKARVNPSGIRISNLPDSLHVSINDTVEFDPTLHLQGPMKLCRWYFLGGRIWQYSSAKSCKAKYVFRKEGKYDCTFFICDTAGNARRDTIPVRVTNLSPQVAVRADTSIRGHDTLSFAWEAKDDGRGLSFKWDFEGDGKWDWLGDSITTLLHRYPCPTDGREEAVFKPALEVVDDDSNRTAVGFRVNVRFDVPRADAGRSTIVCLGDTVEYNGWRSLAVIGEIDRWEWDFDADGEVDTVCLSGEVRRPAPEEAGTRMVKLWVVDEFGNRSAPDSVAIVVVEDHPTAMVDSEATVGLGDTVWFKGKGVKRCGSILEYAWDLDGDEKWDWRSEENRRVFRVFKKPGVYYSKFQVVGNDGFKGNAVRIVRVVAVPPEISVPGDTTIVAGTVLSFRVQASDADGRVVKTGWDFDGDGKIDDWSRRKKVFKHRYKKPGRYQARLTAIDDDGISASAVRVVTVTGLSDGVRESKAMVKQVPVPADSIHPSAP